MTTETPIVLVVDHDRDRAQLYASYLDTECDVRVANDGPGALDALDDDVDVLVLVRPGSGSGVDDVSTALGDRRSDVRVVLIRERDADLAALTRAPDEVLSAPVSAGTLRRTVSVLAAGRAYARGIGDLFSLARKRADVESDGTDDVRALDARIDDLRAQLDRTLATLLDEGDFAAVYRAIDDDATDSDDGDV
ncbi:MAG: HalX domain-containing protein [Haloferacaceae archaeon]